MQYYWACLQLFAAPYSYLYLKIRTFSNLWKEVQQCKKLLSDTHTVNIINVTVLVTQLQSDKTLNLP